MHANEMIDIHQNRFLGRLFLRWRSRVTDNRCNEPEVVNITNNFLNPINLLKYMENNLDTKNLLL